MFMQDLLWESFERWYVDDCHMGRRQEKTSEPLKSWKAQNLHFPQNEKEGLMLPKKY